MSENLSIELNGLKSEISDLKASFASHKPIDSIVRYLLYFWLSLSVVLGFFGWRQLSDLDTQIKRAVLTQFPEESENYRNYKKLIKDTGVLYGDFQELTETYKERVEDLKYAEIIASDFDIEGQIQTIVIESDNPINTLDPEWRAKAILSLEKMADTMKERTFPSTFVFNAAQVCRQLQQFQLAENMTKSAFVQDQSAANRALMLASEVTNNSGEKRIKAFEELMLMVVNLNYESSPQIVLAEAWNTAENSRSYQPFIKSLDALFENSNVEYVPSYAYLIQAQALLRQGTNKSKQIASERLILAQEVFETESSLSQWYEDFVTEYPNVLEIVNREMTIEDTREADQLEALRRFFEEAEGLGEKD